MALLSLSNNPYVQSIAQRARTVVAQFHTRVDRPASGRGSVQLLVGVKAVAGVTWNFKGDVVLAELRVGGADQDFCATVAVPPAMCSIWVDHIVPGLLRPKNERTLGASLSSGSLFIDLWAKRTNWSASDPWWQRIEVNSLDLLFGKVDVQERSLGRSEALLPLDDQGYTAIVTMFERITKRPRGAKQVVRCAHIEIPAGIPLPGKGEDEDDTALFEFVCEVNSVPRAIAHVVEKCQTLRAARPGWRLRAPEDEISELDQD